MSARPTARQCWLVLLILAASLDTLESRRREGLTHFARVLFFLCTSGEMSSPSIWADDNFLFIASARVTAKCQVECQLKTENIFSIFNEISQRSRHEDKNRTNSSLLVHMRIVQKLSVSLPVGGVQ